MHAHTLSSRFLDKVAISMAVICAIHCLVTPILLVALPILATTVWVDANFHLWMILLVIPTTTLAVWSGCRRHKDRWVIGMAAIGLGFLTVALMSERIAQSTAQSDSAMTSELTSGPNEFTANEPNTSACASCSKCLPNSQGGDAAAGTDSTAAGLPWHLLLNLTGGLFLASGHTRNFLLCRKDSCDHSDETHSCKKRPNS